MQKTEAEIIRNWIALNYSFQFVNATSELIFHKTDGTVEYSYIIHRSILVIHRMHEEQLNPPLVMNGMTLSDAMKQVYYLHIVQKKLLPKGPSIKDVPSSNPIPKGRSPLSN